MKKVFLLFLLLAVVFSNTYAEKFEWADVVFLAGRTEDDNDNEACVAADAENIYLAGKFKDSVYLLTEFIESKGGYDIFLANYDPQGNLYWVITAGGPGEDIAKAVAVLSNGDIVITGTFEGAVDFGGQTLTSTRKNNLFIACYDPQGKLKWAQRGGGITALPAVESGTGLAVDANDNIYLTGSFFGADDKGDYTKPGTGSIGDFQIQNAVQATNSFAAKLTPDGKVQWAGVIGHYGQGGSNGICVDENGNCYITGICSATFVFGAQVLNSNGIADIYVAKFNADGSHGWFKQFGSGEKFNPAKAAKYTDPFEFGAGICTDRAGGLFVTGQYVDKVNFGSVKLKAAGGGDIFIMKMDYAGEVQWASSSGKKLLEWVKAIQLDKENNVYITGVNSEYGGLDHYYGIYSTPRGIGCVEKYNGKTGEKMWGAGAGSWGLSLAPFGEDDMILVGSFANQVKFSESVKLDIRGKLLNSEKISKNKEIKTYEAGFGLYLAKIRN